MEVLPCRRKEKDLKKIIGTLSMIVMGFLFIMLLLRYNVGIMKHDSLVTSIEMNVRTVVGDHFSVGTRVNPKGINIIDLQSFEVDFNDMMKAFSTSNVAGEKSKLKYLVEVGKNSQKIVYIDDVKENEKILAVMVTYKLEDRNFNLRYVLEELDDMKRR